MPLGRLAPDHGYAKKCRRNGCGALVRTRVVMFEKRHELIAQLGGTARLLGGFESVHRRAVVVLELLDERRGRSLVRERKSIPVARYVFGCNAGRREPLDDVGFGAPLHWT